MLACMPMKYVYILRSIGFPDRRYIGLADDLKRRVEEHNAGAASHTSKYKPWHVETYVAFTDEAKAVEFEQYLKSGSGKAFARRRFG